MPVGVDEESLVAVVTSSFSNPSRFPVGHCGTSLLLLQIAEIDGPKASFAGLPLAHHSIPLAFLKGGVRKIAAQFGVDPGTVQRISRPFDESAAEV